MKSALICGPVVCLLCGCDNPQAGRSYVLGAFANVGVQPDADGTIIPDAQQRLPRLLRHCRVSDFRHVDASDSFVAFRFVADAAQVNCLRSRMPKGAELRPAEVQ